MIRNIQIDGFKSIVSQTLELGRVNCFIGANGAGKSNVLEAIGVLSASASGRVDLVAEDPTDFIVIEAALKAILQRPDVSLASAISYITIDYY